MDSWQEFLDSSWWRELVAGGIRGIAGIISGYPLHTLRVHQQSSGLGPGSAVAMLRKIVQDEGPVALYRGRGTPLASVTFHVSFPFECDGVPDLCEPISSNRCLGSAQGSPPSYKGVALGGVGICAIQSFILTPVELLKVQLQLQNSSNSPDRQLQHRHRGPTSVARVIFRKEGMQGMCQDLTITMIRDAPSHGVYFWTYEYMRERLHPNCRANRNLRTMLMAGGSAGIASWIFCYPLDVVKTRLQAQSELSRIECKGIVDCFRKSVRDDGYGVLWHVIGTAVAFVVNGAIFCAYETALRWFFNSNGDSDDQIGNST